MSIRAIAKQYLLTCLTCELPDYASLMRKRSEHLANCGAWQSGYDCMHFEDEIDTCKCGDVCLDCGNRLTDNDDDTEPFCEECKTCVACDVDRVVHGCTARSDDAYSLGYDTTKCNTRLVHQYDDEPCACVPEPDALRSDVLTSIAHLQVLITAWQSQSLRDYTPEAEVDAVAVLSFFKHLIEADGIPALNGGE